MNSSLFALIGLSFFLGCGCWLFFLWAVQKGEFSDMERPKHRMLDDDDTPKPAPAAQHIPARPHPGAGAHDLTLAHEPRQDHDDAVKSMAATHH